MSLDKTSVKLPKTAEGWELYASETPAGRVALRAVVQEINTSVVSALRGINAKLLRYKWVDSFAKPLKDTNPLVVQAAQTALREIDVTLDKYADQGASDPEARDVARSIVEEFLIEKFGLRPGSVRLGASSQMVASRYAAGKKIVKLMTWNGKKSVELTPGQHEALQIMPKGKGLELDFRRGSLMGATWNKRGGYADSVRDKLMRDLKTHGFHHQGSQTDSHPADFFTSSASVYTDSEGNSIRYHDHFGVTKFENYHTITLTFKRPAPVLDPEALAEREEEALYRARLQIVEDVLSSVKGLKMKPQVSSPGEAEIGEELLPEWATGTRPMDRKFKITASGQAWGHEAQVSATVRLPSGGYLQFVEPCDADNVRSVTSTVGSVLNQLKNARSGAVEDI